MAGLSSSLEDFLAEEDDDEHLASGEVTPTPAKMSSSSNTSTASSNNNQPDISAWLKKPASKEKTSNVIESDISVDQVDISFGDTDDDKSAFFARLNQDKVTAAAADTSIDSSQYNNTSFETESDDMSSIQSNFEFLDGSKALMHESPEVATQALKLDQPVTDERPIRPMVQRSPTPQSMKMLSSRSISKLSSRAASRSSMRSLDNVAQQASAKPRLATATDYQKNTNLVDQLQRENTLYQQLLDDEKSLSTKYKDQLTVTAAENEKIQTTNSILSAETEDLHKQLKKLQSSIKNTSIADTSFTAAPVDTDSQEVLIRGFKKENDNLSMQVKQLESSAKVRLAEWNKEKQELIEQNRELQTVILQKTGTSPSKETRKAADSQQELRQSREDAAKNIFTKDTEIKTLREKLKATEETIKANESKIRERKPATPINKPTSIPVPVNNAQYSQKIQTLENTVSTLKAQLAKSGDIEDAKAQIVSLLNKVSRLENDNKSIERELTDRVQSLRSRHQEIVSDLEERLSKHEKSSSNCGGATDILVTSLRAEIVELRAKLDSSKYNKMVENFRKELDQKNSECQRLKDEVDARDRKLLEDQRLIEELRDQLRSMKNLDKTPSMMQELDRLRAENHRLEFAVKSAEELRIALKEQYQRMMDESQTVSTKTLLEQQERTLRLLHEESQRMNADQYKKDQIRLQARARDAEDSLDRCREQLMHSNTSIQSLQDQCRIHEHKLSLAESCRVNLDDFDRVTKENSSIKQQLSVFSMSADEQTRMLYGLMVKLEQVEERLEQRQREYKALLNSRSGSVSSNMSMAMEKRFADALKRKDEQLVHLKKEFEFLMRDVEGLK